MKQPTKQEIKEFWEWCGITVEVIEHNLYQATETFFNGVIIVPRLHGNYPFLDLNSLFQYAMPKAIGRIAHTFKISIMQAYEALFKRWLQYLEEDPTHPALALFWAIFEVIKNENG